MSHFCHHLSIVQNRMKTQVDQKHREAKFFVKDLSSTTAKRAIVSGLLSFSKVIPTYFGLFHIIARLDLVAYRLELCFGSRIHNVIHVSQPKKYVDSTVVIQSSLPLINKDLTIILKLIAFWIKELC